jgi:hypothetical protein
VTEPNAEAIVHDYLSRLARALAQLPKDRRDQILDDLRDHVTAALAEGQPANQVLGALGPPEDIANEAYASGPAPARHPWRLRRPHLRYSLALLAVVAALAGGIAGLKITSNSAPVHPAGLTSKVAARGPIANSTCSPATVASASGGPASALTSAATEVASGTTGGQAWTLWSKKGESGARGIEDGGLIIGGRTYGLCPGYPNPAELELADTGTQGLAYGIIGYRGLAKIWLYKSTAGTFDTGTKLPAPQVKIVDGISFFIGTLPRSVCDYPALELNTTSPGVSDEHNLGFGTCTPGKLIPITASQGIWQLPPGQFPKNF